MRRNSTAKLTSSSITTISTFWTSRNSQVMALSLGTTIRFSKKWAKKRKGSERKTTLTSTLRTLLLIEKTSKGLFVKHSQCSNGSPSLFSVPRIAALKMLSLKFWTIVINWWAMTMIWLQMISLQFSKKAFSTTFLRVTEASLSKTGPQSCQLRSQNKKRSNCRELAMSLSIFHSPQLRNQIMFKKSRKRIA